MHEQLQRIRQQITEFKAALQQVRAAINAHRASMQAARFQLEKLISAPGDAHYLFCELANVIQSLSATRLIGAALLAHDGRVLMHSVGCQRVLPIDPVSSTLTQGCFFDPATGVCIEEQQLPWILCLQSTDPQPNTTVLVRQADLAEDLHFELACIGLHRENGNTGAWVLYLDLTEVLRSEAYVQKSIH